jgi:membrane fusion protein (multidrug efflux system)
MSDSLRKVLLGALIGAFVVGFGWHAMSQRAKRAPAAVAATPAPQGGAKQGQAGNPLAGVPATPVIVVPVRSERLSLEIEALGTARANESVDITAKVSNLVTAIRFDEGQYVRRGDVVVELDGDQARADLAVAQAALKESESQYHRSRELYDTKVLSESAIETIEATYRANQARVEAAKARLNDTVVRAPFDGRVGLRRVSVGGLVEPGTVITTLDDVRTIKVDFAVPETAVASMTSGLSFSASSVAYPGRVFAGRVASVDSRVDANTRSVIVRGTLPNGDGALKPGMFLTVKLARGAADVLVVPEESVLPEQGNMFVYVVRDGAATKRRIQTGQRSVGSVQVVEGLRVGELVVTEGTQKLRDGAPVSMTEGERKAVAPTPGTTS